MLVLKITDTALVDRSREIGHNIKWGLPYILFQRKTYIDCLIKVSFLIKEFSPSFNKRIGSEKLLLF